MSVPRDQTEALALLARMSAEAWLQSRAALALAAGATPEEATARAREAYRAAYGESGIDVTHFRLTRV